MYTILKPLKAGLLYDKINYIVILIGPYFTFNKNGGTS